MAELSNVKCDGSFVTVKDGEYVGKWSAYEVRFDTPIGECYGTTDMGVRGINIPCKVVVQSGKCVVKHEPVQRK